MGHFVFKNKVNLQGIDETIKIPESDFAQLMSNGDLLQFEYIEEESELVRKTPIGPELYKIVQTQKGLQIEPGRFSKDQMLDSYTNTETIDKIIDCFFKNLHLYKEFGIEIPKRNVLLHGPPGTGKSSSLQKTIGKYLDDKETSVLIWDSAAFDAHDVKELISSFEYVNGSKKIIVIVEDIGGSSNDGLAVRSSSSLLRLLDNTDKTFTVPVMIIGTTNFIGNLESNLANRSGRFDDRIEIGYPDSNNRIELLKFFSKNTADEECLTLIGSSKCKTFSVAHIKECFIRSKLHEKELKNVINDVIKEIEEYNKAFSKSQSLGF